VALSSGVATGSAIALMSRFSFMYLLTLAPVCCGALSMMTAILPNRRRSSLRNLINVLIKPVVHSKQRAPVCGNCSEDYQFCLLSCILQPAASRPESGSGSLHCHLRGPCTHPAAVWCNPAFSGVKWRFVSFCHFCSRRFRVCLRVSILTFCTTCPVCACQATSTIFLVSRNPVVYGLTVTSHRLCHVDDRHVLVQMQRYCEDSLPCGWILFGFAGLEQERVILLYRPAVTCWDLRMYGLGFLPKLLSCSISRESKLSETDVNADQIQSHYRSPMPNTS